VRHRLRARGDERAGGRRRGPHRPAVRPGPGGVGGASVSKRIRTLVVDDEPAPRAAIRSLLANDGDVSLIGECADGRSALQAIRDDAPDLLFLSVQMPEMAGLAPPRALHATDLPILACGPAFGR